MEPPHAPPRQLRIGLALLLLGALAVAFAAVGLAGTGTPAEGLSEDAGPEEVGEAIDRFRMRLDRQARLQACGLGLVAAGVAVVAGAAGTGPRTTVNGIGRRRRLRHAAVGTGVVAAALVTVARWVSVGHDQFGTTWDHWVLGEALGWVVWGVAIVVAGWRHQALGPPEVPRGRLNASREGTEEDVAR